MRSVAEFRDWAAGKYRRESNSWLADPGLGEDVTLRYPLLPPNEPELARDPEAVADWVGSWRRLEKDASPGVAVDWVDRTWRSYGRQQLPVRVHLGGAAAVAAAAGQAAAWQTACSRATLLRSRWPDASGLGAALAAAGGRVASLSQRDLDCFVRVVDWLVANPASGLLPRQLPIEGVDTKWLERHRGLVETFVAAHTGSRDLGLATGEQRFHVRILDHGLRPDGPHDFTAACPELSRLELAPDVVIVLENQTSLVALEELSGVVAVHGFGYSVTELVAVPWVAASRIIYWGDLDSHGFAILSRIRERLPQVESALMDAATFERFRTLAGPEPSPVRRLIERLTADEETALALVRNGDRRLEQERIEWGYAATALRVAVGGREALDLSQERHDT